MLMNSLIRGGEKLRIETFLDHEMVYELTVGGSTREKCNYAVLREGATDIMKPPIRQASTSMPRNGNMGKQVGSEMNIGPG